MRSCLLSLLSRSPAMAVAAVWFVAGGLPLAWGDVQLHPLISNGVVLQRGGPVNIWGTADDQEKITVDFRGRTVTTQADAGRFRVAIEPGDAGGPFELTVTGKNSVTVKDVYVGEVWFCSGQSNMEWRLGASDASDKEAAAAAKPDAMLRLFAYDKTKAPSMTPRDTIEGGAWSAAEPVSAMKFSAVGYFFGGALRAAMPDVPVGLIQSAWGGTRAEAWTSRSQLETVPAYKAECEALDRSVAAFAAGKVAPAVDPKTKKAKAPSDPARQPNSMAVLFNGMVHPFLPFGIRGVIWYQGESNASKAYAYRELFPMMIADWRKHWGRGDFPFLFVQLAPFMAISDKPMSTPWAELREAQTLTEKTTPKTAMAVISDFGHEGDIHPTPKRPVGERLALLARADVYGHDVVARGPMFEKLAINGSQAVVTFKNAPGGLMVRSLVASDPRGPQKLSAWRVQARDAAPAQPDAAAPREITGVPGFALCGADGVWHNATASVSGETVVLASPAVDKPVAVRYGWTNHPVITLFNAAGLPAVPFRTDDQPWVTNPQK